MGSPKKSIWIDIVFILVGVMTLLLLFMPAEFYEYRIAGYIGALIFLVYLVVREFRRKRAAKGGETVQDDPKKQNDETDVA